MSQLHDFYKLIMDDPDVVPPKNVSKKAYALDLAQQRTKQHENNEKALGLGFTKSHEDFSPRSSSVDRLSSFLASPEPSAIGIEKSDDALLDVLANLVLVVKDDPFLIKERGSLTSTQAKKYPRHLKTIIDLGDKLDDETLSKFIEAQNIPIYHNAESAELSTEAKDGDEWEEAQDDPTGANYRDAVLESIAHHIAKAPGRDTKDKQSGANLLAQLSGDTEVEASEVDTQIDAYMNRKKVDPQGKLLDEEGSGNTRTNSSMNDDLKSVISHLKGGINDQILTPIKDSGIRTYDQAERDAGRDGLKGRIGSGKSIREHKLGLLEDGHSLEDALKLPLIQIATHIAEIGNLAVDRGTREVFSPEVIDALDKAKNPDATYEESRGNFAAIFRGLDDQFTRVPHMDTIQLAHLIRNLKLYSLGLNNPVGKKGKAAEESSIDTATELRPTETTGTRDSNDPIDQLSGSQAMLSTTKGSTGDVITAALPSERLGAFVDNELAASSWADADGKALTSQVWKNYTPKSPKGGGSPRINTDTLLEALGTKLGGDLLSAPAAEGEGEQAVTGFDKIKQQLSASLASAGDAPKHYSDRMKAEHDAYNKQGNEFRELLTAAESSLQDYAGFTTDDQPDGFTLYDALKQQINKPVAEGGGMQHPLYRLASWLRDNFNDDGQVLSPAGTVGEADTVREEGVAALATRGEAFKKLADGVGENFNPNAPMYSGINTPDDVTPDIINRREVDSTEQSPVEPTDETTESTEEDKDSVDDDVTVPRKTARDNIIENLNSEYSNTDVEGDLFSAGDVEHLTDNRSLARYAKALDKIRTELGNDAYQALRADETNPLRLQIGTGGTYGIEAQKVIDNWNQQEGNTADPIASNGGTKISNGRSTQNDDGSINMEIFNQQFKEGGGRAEELMKAYGFIAAVDDGDVKAGDILERGEGFFEAIVPMLQDAYNHMQQNVDGIMENFATNDAPLPEGFHFMNMDKKGIERYPAASNTLLGWAINELNKGLPRESRLHPVFDPTDGTLLAGKKENPTLTTADIAGVLSPEKMNQILLKSKFSDSIKRGVADREDINELLNAYDHTLRSELEANGVPSDKAKKIVTEALNEVKETVSNTGDVAEIDNVDTKITQAVEETLTPEELEAYDNQLSQVDASALGILERLGVPAPIPQATASGEQAAEGKTSQQKRIDKAAARGLLDHILENSPLSVDADTVEELKEELAGMDLDKLDKFFDKHSKDKAKVEATQQKADAAEEAERVKAQEATAKEEAASESTFDWDATLNKLAKLRHPDLFDEEGNVLDQEAHDKVMRKLSEDEFNPKHGSTDKDLQEAFKAQRNLNANQEAQESRARAEKRRGADKVMSITNFNRDFPEPDEDMSPEEAKDQLRRLIDFQHRDENFAHFDPKTDPDNYKAARERQDQYSKINPEAITELASEIQEASRAGIDTGSDEYLQFAEDRRTEAENKQRADDNQRGHREARLDDALRNGAFDRSVDAEGNAVRNRLDPTGKHEHVEDDAVHQDGESPRVQALNEDGSVDESLQALVDDVHNAKLASPQRAYDKALHDSYASRSRDEAEAVENHRTEVEGHGQTREEAHANLEADNRATREQIDEDHKAADIQSWSDVRRDTNQLTEEHNSNVAQATEEHANRLAEHDKLVDDDQVPDMQEWSNTKRDMVNSHNDNITQQEEVHQGKLDELQENARESLKQRNKDRATKRGAATKNLKAGREKINEAYKASVEESDKQLAEVRSAIGDKHVEELEQLKAGAPDDVDAKTDAVINALKEHPEMVKNPAALANILDHTHLGRSAEDSQKGHEESESGEDEQGKPTKTRMVEDPTTGEMKKQYWIPGRGKGWVDEDTYNASHGQNATAASNGKMMIYPEGHFDKGHGVEGDENFRPPSAPMAAFGGNMMGIEHATHSDWQGADGQPHHDDSLDHEGVVGRHLGQQTGITGHENYTAGGAPFEVDPSDVGMSNIAEQFGRGKGSKAEPRTTGQKIRSQIGTGEAAAARAGSWDDAAGKVFDGAANWLKERYGGLNASPAQRVANAIRGVRQTGRQKRGGAYKGSFKPQNTEHANLQEEVWRRIPKLARSAYSLSNPDHARELNTRIRRKDNRERQSSEDQLALHEQDVADKLKAESKGKS